MWYTSSGRLESLHLATLDNMMLYSVMATLEAKWLPLIPCWTNTHCLSHKRTNTHTHTGEILTYRSEHCKLLFSQPQVVVLYACRIFHLNKQLTLRSLGWWAKSLYMNDYGWSCPKEGHFHTKPKWIWLTAARKKPIGKK
jgi:hypothetical protein